MGFGAGGLAVGRKRSRKRGLGPGLGPGRGPGLGPGRGPGLGPGLGRGLGPGLGRGLGPGRGATGGQVQLSCPQLLGHTCPFPQGTFFDTEQQYPLSWCPRRSHGIDVKFSLFWRSILLKAQNKF